jgi:beta-lactamase class D
VLPILAILITLCLPSPVLASEEPRSETRPSLERHFARHDVEGSFVLFDSKRSTFVRYRPERCAKKFIPASTFKIFNTLVALETGVVKDENIVLDWDGVERPIKAWNESQDLKTADNVYFFATNLESRDPEFKMYPVRRQITHAILEELDVLPLKEGSSN